MFCLSAVSQPVNEGFLLGFLNLLSISSDEWSSMCHLLIVYKLSMNIRQNKVFRIEYPKSDYPISLCDKGVYLAFTSKRPLNYYKTHMCVLLISLSREHNISVKWSIVKVRADDWLHVFCFSPLIRTDHSHTYKKKWLRLFQWKRRTIFRSLENMYKSNSIIWKS